MIVEEGNNITLPCITNCSIEKDDTFDWKKNGLNIYYIKEGKPNCGPKFDEKKYLVRYYTENLNHVNVSLTIFNLNEHDGGEYSCVYTPAYNGDHPSRNATWTVGKNFTNNFIFD